MYKLRYPDNLSNNFNIAILTREFLAELDFMVVTIQQSFHIYFNKEEKEIELFYHEDKNNNNPLLLNNNHVLAGVDKKIFILSDRQIVYEMCKCPIAGLREVYYLAEPSLSDGNFMREGFIPLNENGTAYQTLFKNQIPLHCSHNGQVLQRML